MLDPLAGLYLALGQMHFPVQHMNTLSERITLIKEQVTRLTRAYQALRVRASELEQEVHDHRRTSEVLKARVNELERENEALRKAKSHEIGPRDSGTNERIDELVNEIDRCLALISPANTTN